MKCCTVTFINGRKWPEKTKDMRQGIFKLTEHSYALMIHTRPEMYRSANYLACKDFASLMVWSFSVDCIVIVMLINLGLSSALIIKWLMCMCVPIWSAHIHRVKSMQWVYTGCYFENLVILCKNYFLWINSCFSQPPVHPHSLKSNAAKLIDNIDYIFCTCVFLSSVICLYGAVKKYSLTKQYCMSIALPLDMFMKTIIVPAQNFWKKADFPSWSSLRYHLTWSLSQRVSASCQVKKMEKTTWYDNPNFTGQW